MEIIEHWKNLSLKNIIGEMGGIVVEEVWKDIDCFEGRYQVSTFGRVKSLKRKITDINKNYILNEKILKQAAMTNGYKFIALCKNSVYKQLSIHRLVAIAFIPNPDNKPEVNHKKGIKIDNRVSELEWSTRSENQLHSYKIGIMKPPRAALGKFGKDNPSSKKIIQCDLNGNEIAVFYGMAEARRVLKMPHINIGEVCRGEQKTSGGFKWKWG